MLERNYIHHRRILLSLWTSTSFLLLAGSAAWAGTANDRAKASIAVARAAIDIAEERAALPETMSSPESETERKSMLPRARLASTASEADESGVESNRPPKSIGPVPSRPLRMEVARATTLTEPLPAQLVVGGWEQGCPACIRQQKDLRSVLIPLGWTVGNRVSDQIRLIHLPQTDAVPSLVLYQNGKAIKHWQGYRDPAALSQELRQAWDQAPALDAGPAAMGTAGTIQGRETIRAALDWWREQIGESRPVQFRWDRTGDAAIHLLANGDWSAQAIFGEWGHMEFSAPGAVRLPVDAAGFGYRISGSDMILDLDPLKLEGFARQLSVNPSRTAAEIEPARAVGPIMAWSVISTLYEVWQLLHPVCDLQLGGSIVGTGRLDQDRLTIEFQKSPAVRIIALFTFDLKVQRVEITESTVRLVFQGSRLIKERTFTVK